MAIIGRDAGYLYICQPGTACTATADTLLDHYGGQWIPSEDLRNRRGKLLAGSKHSTLKDLRTNKLISRRERKSLCVFVTVRNPFDFWPSEWLRLKRWTPLLEDPNSWMSTDRRTRQRVRAAAENDFNDFLAGELKRKRRKPRHLAGGYIKGVDEVLRFESLQQDFDRLLERLGIGRNIYIDAYNVTKARDRDYRIYYNDASVALIYDVYAPDFERFGYSFETAENTAAQSRGPGPARSRNLVGNGSFRHWAADKPDAWALVSGKVSRCEEVFANTPVIQLEPDPARKDPTQLLQQFETDIPFEGSKIIAAVNAQAHESNCLTFGFCVEIDGKEACFSATHSGDGAWRELQHAIDIPSGATLGSGSASLRLLSGATKPGRVARASVTVVK